MGLSGARATIGGLPLASKSWLCRSTISIRLAMQHTECLGLGLVLLAILRCSILRSTAQREPLSKDPNPTSSCLGDGSLDRLARKLFLIRSRGDEDEEEAGRGGSYARIVWELG